MLRAQLFDRLARFSTRRPWSVLMITALLSLASIYAAATHLAVKTSNLDLVDPDLPTIRAFLDFAGEFGSPNVLVVALEGSDEIAMQKAVDELEPEFQRLPEVHSVIGKIPFDSGKLESAGVDPYLTSRDRGLYLILIQPADTRSQAETIAPLLESVRAVIAEGHYDLRGIRVGLTGIPQYAIDDRDVIQQDISSLSLVSLVLIALLFVGAFAALRRPLMAVLTLGFAVVIIIGLISLYPGHLTLLSAFFASILFGLGIDYGIHIINRAEEFMHDGLAEAEAIPRSITALAPELTTGAITTSIVFISMMISGFRGFAELGLIAGVGILVCLLFMVTLLPALLALVPHRQNRTISTRQSRVGRILLALQHPVVALSILVISLFFCFAGHPGFDGNYTNLQPTDSEAVRLERAMVERSDLSPQFAAFTTDNKAKALDLADRLVDEPTVGSVRSIGDLEMLGALSDWPSSFVQQFMSTAGHFAVYAYPSGNVWNPEEQAAFSAAMQQYDQHVTGMPILGKFMTELSNRAMNRTGIIGGFFLLLCVFINFRRFTPTLIAVIPTLLTVAGLHGVMKTLGMSFNPINIMALPVILGIAVDDGIHMVHRFIQEKGDVARMLTGSGRSVVLTSLTTIAAFGSLAFTRHRGLASFSILLVIGVGIALIISVLVLPALLKCMEKRLVQSQN